MPSIGRPFIYGPYFYLGENVGFFASKSLFSTPVLVGGCHARHAKRARRAQPVGIPIEPISGHWRTKSTACSCTVRYHEL